MSRGYYRRTPVRHDQRRREYGPARSKCRDCHQEISWVQLVESGKRIPLDPSTDPELGTVRVTIRDGNGRPYADGPRARRLSGMELITAQADATPLRVAHWDTCIARRSHNPMPPEVAAEWVDITDDIDERRRR
jgi:hypothetical protein